jgi:hypothetical protein
MRPYPHTSSIQAAVLSSVFRLPLVARQSSCIRSITWMFSSERTASLISRESPPSTRPATSLSNFSTESPFYTIVRFRHRGADDAHERSLQLTTERGAFFWPVIGAHNSGASNERREARVSRKEWRLSPGRAFQHKRILGLCCFRQRGRNRDGLGGGRIQDSQTVG